MEEYFETELTDDVIDTLIAFSADWESEQNTYGYRKNTPEDILGNRVFLVKIGGKAAGYLFGKIEKSKP